MSKVRYLFLDIDGTLTDGRIYMGDNSELIKAFNIKDGFGIHDMLIPSGITPIVITGRQSGIVLSRCKELGISMVFQGVKDKASKLLEIVKGLQCGIDSCAYMGDDLNDLPCMNLIRDGGGIVGCPADSVEAVKKLSLFVSAKSGGDGAVRDFIEYILKANLSESPIQFEKNKKRVEQAVIFISNLDFANLQVGRYQVSPDFFYMVQAYTAFEDTSVQFESHRKYIDIQWVYEGKELLSFSDVSGLIPLDKYNEEKDVIHYRDSYSLSSVVLSEGNYAILFPKDAHKFSRVQGNMSFIKKVVGKLEMVL
jgi:3-deoxy-D-manno-octulosonate 8-phosphate phosphatase (KDO 8-P phosphatase)